MNAYQEKLEKKYQTLVQSFSEEEVKQAGLRSAFEAVCTALNGQTRENGDPFVFHALDVANIVAHELGIGMQAAAAVLLHEADRVVNFLPENIEEQYGKTTATVVTGLRKISQIDIKTTGLQAEAFRKLIVSYSTHPLVILIKLADRLEVMRSLSFFPKTKHAKKSAETLLLYTPLAHKLGLYKLNSELEDLSLRYSNPAAYRDIATKLHLSQNQRQQLVSNFVAPIEQALQNIGLQFVIKHRTKSIYSIYKKMQKQNIPFQKVYDVFAIRIILDSAPECEKDDCWRTYSVITSHYQPDEKRLRDWVTVPKNNGYESLHTTVAVGDGQYVEVQIRTQRMDDEAENGTAAHWRYKGVKQDSARGIEDWLGNIRQLLSSNTTEDEVKQHFDPQEIFVYTPEGDLRQLPKGATVLDFAFDIHSNLGCRCTGALRNGKAVPIREVLKTGDTVEIITSKNQTPSLDWLSFVVTGKAKGRINHKLHENEAKVAAEGKEQLERKLKNHKVTLNIDPITALTQYFKFKTTTELYVKFALEELEWSQVNEALNNLGKNGKSTPVEKEPKIAPVEKKEQPRSTTQSSDFVVINDTLKSVDYKFSKCCNPIFGDDVFGFVSIGKGITIHRTNCPNAERLTKLYPYRVVNAQWRQENAGSFQTIVKITANNVVGLQHQIAESVSAVGSVMRSINLASQKGLIEGQMQVYVKSSKQLEMLLYRLNHLKSVHKAVRVQ